MDRIIYLADGFWREVGDPRVQLNYPFMDGGPVPVMLLIILYLYFVKIGGPRWMKSREPFELKWTIRIYNIATSIVNFYITYEFCRISTFGIRYFGCVLEKDEPGMEEQSIPIGGLYTASKAVELLDTIFFILRKKYSQASTLHVFHHSSVLITSWFFFKIGPTMNSGFFLLLNSAIHTVMYTYYFLATFKQLQPYLWWKRYITTAQLVQFVFSLVHFTLIARPSCPFNTPLAVAGMCFTFIFIFMFSNFYYHSYIKKGRPGSAQVQSDRKRS